MRTESDKQREAREFEAYENRQENQVDLTGTQEELGAGIQDLTSHELHVSNQLPEENKTLEDFGVHEAAQAAALEVDRPPDPDEGTVNDAVNDHRLSTSKDVYGGRKTNMPDEVELTHLRHPKTGIVFPVNEVIIKQKHLIPCDEKGKIVHDNRVFNRFN